MTVRIAHFSDLHLGYEAYAARSPRGFNQRGEDVVRAVHRVVDDIIAADPPLVVCSGDVAELPQIPVRYMLAAATEFQRLAAIRPDGTRRQLVVIAGNHDQSKHVRDGCFLDLYRGLPGMHVVTQGYRQLRFDTPELADVVVHALPHDALRELETLGVAPVEGALNILTAHGVAESSELYRRAVGREYLIPAELLLMEWAYVALGHWHTQGPVFPLGFAADHSRIWYAGSVESVDFGDVRGGSCTERGWLLVDADATAEPVVMPQRHPVRPMVNLEVIEATGLAPEAIAAQLVAAVTDELTGAVVRQRVHGVSREIWSLVDTAPAYLAATGLVHYRIEPQFLAAPTGTGDEPRGLAQVGGLLAERITATVPEADRTAVLELAQSLLRQVAIELVPEDPPDETTEEPGADAEPLDGAVEDAALDRTAEPHDDAPAEPAATGSGTAVVADAAEAEPTAPASLAVNVPAALDEDQRAAAISGLLAEFDGLRLGAEDPT